MPKPFTSQPDDKALRAAQAAIAAEQPGLSTLASAVAPAPDRAPNPLAPTGTALPGLASGWERDPLNIRLLAQRDSILDVLRQWGVVQHQLLNGAIQEPPRRLVLRSRSLSAYLTGDSNAEPTR